MIEAQVMATSPIAGKRLRDVSFPKGSIVGAVMKASGLVMPKGDLVLNVGDIVVVFAVRDAVRQVEGRYLVGCDAERIAAGRPDAPVAMLRASISTTSRAGFSSLACTAAQRPVKPPPTMSRSQRISCASAGSSCGRAGASSQ